MFRLWEVTSTLSHLPYQKQLEALDLLGDRVDSAFLQDKIFRRLFTFPDLELIQTALLTQSVSSFWSSKTRNTFKGVTRLVTLYILTFSKDNLKLTSEVNDYLDTLSLENLMLIGKTITFITPVSKLVDDKIVGGVMNLGAEGVKVIYEQQLYHLLNKVFYQSLNENREDILDELLARADLYTLSGYLNKFLVDVREDYFYKTLNRYLSFYSYAYKQSEDEARANLLTKIKDLKVEDSLQDKRVDMLLAINPGADIKDYRKILTGSSNSFFIRFMIATLDEVDWVKALHSFHGSKFYTILEVLNEQV